MKKGFVFKAWVYFLCGSFLLLASGFHTRMGEAKEMGRPLGEMVSRGEVKFESKKGVWKPVEPSQFPIFEGVRIKTERGASLMTLENNSQIDVGQNSLLFFDRNDQLHLTHGAIDFRLPSMAELRFKVGDFTVMRSKSLHASKIPSAISPKNEVTIGSISVHSNGAVTVESLRGSLSVLNREHAVLASLSSNNAITFPSITAKASSNVMVARASQKTGDPAESSKFLGVPIWIWTATVSVVAIVAVVVIGAVTYHGGGDGTPVPVCP